MKVLVNLIMYGWQYATILFELLRHDLKNIGQQLMPIGSGFNWLPEIVWPHAVSDTLIALAYFTIPLGIYRIMKKRNDIEEAQPLLMLFIAFIVLCGMTHLTAVYNIWHTSYHFSSTLKALTALVSVATATMLWPAIPRILKIPSAAALRRSNAQLEIEIQERVRAEKALQKQQENLEQLVKLRTHDLEKAAQRLRRQINEFEEAEQKILFQAQLLDQVETAVIATDVQYHIIYWNHCAEKVYGWKSHEVIGKKATDILIRKDQQQSSQLLLKKIQNKKSWEGEFTVAHKSSRKIPVHLNCAATINSSGHHIGFTLVSYDISHHVRSEKLLQKAKEKAERKASARQDFLSTMSHEIRTPLNVIMGMTRLMLDEKPRPDQMDYLRSLQFSANHLLIVINDILDLSKIEAGKVKLEKISFSPREVLADVENAFTIRAEEKKLELRTEVDPQVPAAVIGDQVRLTQVLNNLVSNAIKFTEKGFVSIHMGAEPRPHGITQLTIIVKDSGIGISKDKLDTIFESYTQAEENTTRKFGGTGLGLTITKKLIDIQDGEMQVNSLEGIGSTFRCEIPYETDNSTASELIETIQEERLISLKGNYILLVEDNHANRMVASNFLRKMGAEVDFAQNGQEALEMVSSQQYHIILMDLQMPVMDGYEATRAIRAMGDAYADIPIIALTADVVADVRIKAQQAGMNDYLSKPFVPEVLNVLLARYLKKSEPLEETELQHHTLGAEDSYTLEHILAEYGKDAEFAHTLLESLGRSLYLLQEEVSHLAEKRDITALRAMIHKMRPSLRMLQNKELEEQLLSLRKMLSKNNLTDTEIRLKLEEIEMASRKSIFYIESLRQRKQPLDADTVKH
ncbi:MAG: response regulator [Cyclobacteriaceae bacterium]